MSIPLNLYHIFYTAARHGNISAASKELFISQPAVSKSITKLEQSLNTSLFLRSSRGVKLTPEGELLYRQLLEAFRSISFGEEQIRKRSELGVGHISLGVSATLCKYVLLPYLQNFIRENPHTGVSISCQSTFQTVQALQSGSLDLGLIGEPDRKTGLTFYPVMEVEDIFVTTRRYLARLSERTGIRPEGADISELSQHAAFLMLDRENLTRQYIDRCLTGEGLFLKQIIEVTSMDLLVEFAKIDMGIAGVIRNFVKDELKSGILTQIQLPALIPTRKIGFACHRDNNPSIQKFMQSFPTV